MKNVREHIYLAALLHDLGKFYQRADTGSTDSSKYLTSSVKNLENALLPSFNGIRSHKHALWTAQFIIENEIVFKNLVGSDIADLRDKNNLMQVSAGHHLPFSQQSSLGKIVKEADSLSSGMDRDSEIALKDAQDESEAGWNDFKKKRMSSVLESIGLTKEELERKNDRHHIPVESITLTNRYFPSKNFDTIANYEKLWFDFVRDFKLIQANTYRAFSETLLNLLFKYAGCIPSSTVHFPDVSLYDHSKMTAALAVCLYDYEQENNKTPNPFLLIGADFSGIQPYIYQIVSKYAGKNLKGRSFYLRILADAVVKYILKELNLFQANIVYNSGGSFYLIAPNTVFVREKLAQIIDTIEQKMFKAHGTTLFLAIDYVTLSKDALMHRNGENLTEAWDDLFQKRDNKKNRKFSYVIKNNYADLFEPMHFGIETDRVTGEGISQQDNTHKVEEVGCVKQLTYQQIELGKRLRDSDILAVSEGEVPYWRDKNPIEPAGLGIFFYLLKKDDLKQLKQQLRGSADHISIVTLNGKEGNCEFMYGDSDNDLMMQGVNNIYGLDFYGGNIFDGNSFDKFCKKEGEDAFRRLGILRMDVDNLGSIFQEGILPDRVTLSRYAALSRSFDYFFSGYINTIQQEVAPNTSFIVYSGGDDLFIVASWQDAIELAKRIRYDFRLFTCHNPAFSLSGGIAIVTPKFPIMRGAKESEGEEMLAKAHNCDGKMKNALSLMLTPLNWEEEFPVVEQLKSKIVELATQETLPKSFIGKVLQHKANAEIENHKIGNLRISWLIPYDMGRMVDRNTSVGSKHLIDNYKKEVCGRQAIKLNGIPVKTLYHPLELWAFAARWAELEIRTNK